MFIYRHTYIYAYIDIQIYVYAYIDINLFISQACNNQFTVCIHPFKNYHLIVSMLRS